MEKYTKDWSEIFIYDETSRSCLRWKHGNNHRMKPGDVAGTFSGGYWQVKVNYRPYKIHRIVLALAGVEVPVGLQVDHRDRNARNNCISNLRVVTVEENLANRGRNKSNTSGIDGINFLSVKDKKYVRYTKTLHGKKVSKCFSVAKYGADKALEMAMNVKREFENAL